MKSMISLPGRRTPSSGLTNISNGENKKVKFNKCQRPRMI
jgi:hypothetical protein